MKNLTPRLRILFAAGIFAAGAGCSSVSGAPLPDTVSDCLVEARTAFAQHDVAHLDRVLKHAESLNGPADKSAEVQRLRAVVEWKYHARFDAARKRLLKATEAAEPEEAWIALARLESYRGEHGAALKAAHKGVKRSRRPFQQTQALTEYGKAAVGQALVQRRRGKTLTSGEDLNKAFELLHEFVREEPGYLEPSRFLMQSALLLGRGDAALEAWRSYFHVTSDRPAPNAIANAGERLTQLLPEWHDNPSKKTQAELVHALADSRLYLEAMIVAMRPGVDPSLRHQPEIESILAYEKALRDIEDVTREYYRRLILGQDDRQRWQKELTRSFRAAAENLPGIDAEKLTREELEGLLDRNFEVHISVERTAGYLDLHMGHRVIDETRNIEQYGQSARLRFIALDNMVSNGFQSWAWESGQHGGWAEAHAIWQVRPAYADGALDIWRGIHDEKERSEFEENMARETKKDEKRAQDNPHGFLPGLSMRLMYQAVFNIYDELQDQGLEGRTLKLAFLAAFEQDSQESSIYAHEGRHSLDTATQTIWRKEYNAKLSEVVFAPRPRLALNSIFNANIGSETPHGRANARLMRDLSGWMEEHTDEIAALDSSRPVLLQFDQLTDEQIRTAFRDLDPLARAHSKATTSP